MKIYCLLIIANLFHAGLTAQTSSTVEIKDIVYRQVGDWEGKLDIYFPDNNHKNALVFYVHGGGWTHGSKNNEYEKIKVFIENGYTVANIGYRVAKEAIAPAAVEDVQCALGYLLKNAKKYNIDKNKVILMGGSAGAHLALLVGLQSPDPIFGCSLGPDRIAISGIISKYGPTDLLTWDPATNKQKGSSAWLGDRINDTTFLKTLSPVNFVSSSTKNIPVLFIHGSDDRSVPIEQSIVLYDKLKKNTNRTELHVVEQGKHGNFNPDETEIMNQKMINFIRSCVE